MSLNSVVAQWRNTVFNVCYLCFVSFNISALISIRKNGDLGTRHRVMLVHLHHHCPWRGPVKCKTANEGQLHVCVCVCASISDLCLVYARISRTCATYVHSLDISVEHARDFNLSLINVVVLKKKRTWLTIQSLLLEENFWKINKFVL